MRPLYVSPIGRGGVDFGIQNILRSVRRAGAPEAELLRLAELYNFAPMLIQRGLPPDWHHGFDLTQGRSRVGFALRVPGKPLVTTVHHLTTDPELQPYSSFQQRLFYRFVESQYDRLSIQAADAVVCVSRYTQRQVEQRYGRHDTVLIYDGMDSEVFAPTPDLLRSDQGLPARPERIRLLFIGNRTRRKGFDLLPQIMDALPDEYVLYYNGGFQDTGALPQHPRMVNIGRPDRTELVAAYQSCDIFLFPSRLEGFGIAPAEAMLCGRPVVTTNISALPEVVDHGLNGFLCPRDDVVVYAERVRELGEDAALRRQFGEHGRAKIMRSFGYDQLGQGFVELYRRLLG
jgi:glycosyltransferase involved in cell wall biosynthesis